MKIDDFFAKESDVFFSFRHVFNSALKFNKSIEFNLIDDMIYIELVDTLPCFTIMGKCDFINDESVNLSNIFHPFLIDIFGMTINKMDFFYYPSYSQPIANFFIKNLAFALLNPSKSVYLSNRDEKLSNHHRILCDKIKNIIFHRYKETFLIAYPNIDKNLLEYHTFKLLGFSGIRLGVDILDAHLNKLSQSIECQYQLNKNSMIADSFILERNNIIDLRYNWGYSVHA